MSFQSIVFSHKIIKTTCKVSYIRRLLLIKQWTADCSSGRHCLWAFSNTNYCFVFFQPKQSICEFCETGLSCMMQEQGFPFTVKGISTWIKGHNIFPGIFHRIASKVMDVVYKYWLVLRSPTLYTPWDLSDLKSWCLQNGDGHQSSTSDLNIPCVLQYTSVQSRKKWNKQIDNN